MAEGVVTSKSVHALCEKHGIEMPICEAVYQVLHCDVPLKEALKLLQARPLRSEDDDAQPPAKKHRGA